MLLVCKVLTLSPLATNLCDAANISRGMEYCENEEEGQMEEGVAVYDISAGCTVM